ncbi:MAG: hypothetical protein KHX29_04365, partial [Prevotella buccalis]|nr:hypothetical protein [Hoylesella buccalis]
KHDAKIEVISLYCKQLRLFYPKNTPFLDVYQIIYQWIIAHRCRQQETIYLRTWLTKLHCAVTEE